MKLIDLKCPNCGSVLQVNPEQKEVYCQYCGAKLAVDDEVQHVQYDNAEQAGYEFEKGRQRAQAEQQYNYNTVPQQPYQQTYTQPQKKKHTWLWVLGWIFCFPIPLTVLIARSQKLNTKVKAVLIAILWIVVLIIGFTGNSNDSTITENTDVSTSTSEKAEEQSLKNLVTENTDTTSSTSKKTEKQSSANLMVFADDETVNKFIENFNNRGTLVITDISKGNIRTKYFGNANGCYMEMLNAYGNASDALIVTINEKYDGSNKDATFEVLFETIKVLDPSIEDDKINEAIAQFKENDVSMEYSIGESINIEYMPSKEISSGRTKGWIKISSNKFK